MHLVSRVEGHLSEGCPHTTRCGRASRPALLTGAPKIRAMEIIAELESDRRGPYGGAVGYFDFSGNMDTGITIRTIAMKDGVAYISGRRRHCLRQRPRDRSTWRAEQGPRYAERQSSKRRRWRRAWSLWGVSGTSRGRKRVSRQGRHRDRRRYGIGRAIALGFAREGAAVAIADLDGEKTRAVAAEIEAAGWRAIGFATDVSRTAPVDAMVEETVRTLGAAGHPGEQRRPAGSQPRGH